MNKLTDKTDVSVAYNRIDKYHFSCSSCGTERYTDDIDVLFGQYGSKRVHCFCGKEFPKLNLMAATLRARIMHFRTDRGLRDTAF